MSDMAGPSSRAARVKGRNAQSRGQVQKLVNPRVLLNVGREEINSPPRRSVSGVEHDVRNSAGDEKAGKQSLETDDVRHHRR